MIPANRTRSVLSTLAILSVLFLPANPGIAQADKFQEDMQQGETALNQRNYDVAVNAYKSAIRDGRVLTGAAYASANATANLGLSRAYLGLGAFKNAIQGCDEALKHTGASTALEAMVRNQRGLAIVASVTKAGDPKLEEAVAEFRKVLEITDKDPLVSYNLGATLLKLNRDTEGIHELQVFVARAGRTTESDTARRMIEDPRRARENFAPDFSLTTLDGEYVTLEDLRGKVVLLDFWGTWCPPCRESTPSLVRYQKKHSAEVFVMVGIAVNEPSAQSWRDYIEKNKMIWPQYLDSPRKISSLFQVSAFPTYVVIDADGVIRDRRTGWNSETMTSIDDQVRKAVKARATSTPPVLGPAPRPSIPSSTTTTSVAPVPALNPVTIATTAVAPVTQNPVSASAAGVVVRGHVIRLPGANANLRVNLIQPGNLPATTTVLAAPDGSFEFSNVRPGNYTVTVSAPVPIQPIIVGNQDLTGIEFTVPPMRILQGRTIIEGNPAAAASGLRLPFTIVYANGSAGVGTQVQTDGSFSVLLPEGEHRVALSNLPGYATKSIVFGSIDLLKEPLKLSATDAARLEVTLVRTSLGGPAPGRPTVTAPLLLGDPVGAGPVTEPALVSQVQPQYTQQARDARLQGTVKLRVVVRNDGMVGDIQVVQGLGLGLDEAAVAAVQQWRFRPATKSGEPVATLIEILVNFSLAANPR